MRTSEFVLIGTTFETMECSCGVVYALTSYFIEERRADHRTFYCPNGCRRHFPQESDEERYKRLLGEERDRVASLRASRDQTEASLRATKGVVTKQRKTLARVARGVCPCCNRSFGDLERHMATKHPNYRKELA